MRSARRDRVARTVINCVRRVARLPGVSLRPVELNGRPGALFPEAQQRLIGVCAIDIVDGQIPIQHGWQVHQAVQTWTNQSETKASFLLGIEAGLFVFFGTRGVNPGDNIEKDIGASVPLLLIFTLGLVCLFAALGTVILVVLPRLREKHLAGERQHHGIFFGHLKGLEEDRIKELLCGPTVLDQLAHQLKVSSGIAWTKHKRLQISMYFGVAGITLIVLSYAVAIFT
jgi:hypothetical protein